MVNRPSKKFTVSAPYKRVLLRTCCWSTVEMHLICSWRTRSNSQTGLGAEELLPAEFAFFSCCFFFFFPLLSSFLSFFFLFPLFLFQSSFLFSPHFLSDDTVSNTKLLTLPPNLVFCFCCFFPYYHDLYLILLFFLVPIVDSVDSCSYCRKCRQLYLQ